MSTPILGHECPQWKPSGSPKCLFLNQIGRKETDAPIAPPSAPGMHTTSACSGTTKKFKEIEYHEETEGFLSYRIADRRGDHSDHRGYRYSELAALENRSERIIRGGLSSHHQHGGSDVSVELGQRFRGRFDAAGRSLPLYRSDFGRSLPNRPALERCSSHQERLCLQRSRHSLST